MDKNIFRAFGFAVVTGLMLSATAFGTSISSVSQLKSNLGSSGTATLQLMADITVSESLTVMGTKTLDLNGHTITSTGYPASANDTQFGTGEWGGLFVLRKGAKFTLDGEGIVKMTKFGAFDGIIIRTDDNTGIVVTLGKGVTAIGQKIVYVQAQIEDYLGYVPSEIGTEINVYGKCYEPENTGTSGLLFSTDGVKNLNINVYEGALVQICQGASRHFNIPNGTTGSLCIYGGTFNCNAYYMTNFAIDYAMCPNFDVRITGGYFADTQSWFNDKPFPLSEGCAFVPDTTQYACRYRVAWPCWQIVGNEKKYASFSAALADAQRDDTICLLGNATDNVVDEAGKAVTIDLNGHTLTSSGGAVSVKNGGALTVKNGTISSVSYFAFVINGDLVLDGVNGTASSNYGVYVDSCYQTPYPASLTICGESVLTTVAAGKPTVALFGNAAYPAIFNVESGVIKNDGGSVAVSASGSYQPTDVTISGGEFDAIQTYGNGKWTITGGTFKSEPPVVAEGHEVVKNADGTFTVRPVAAPEVVVIVPDEVDVTDADGEEIPTDKQETVAEVVEAAKQTIAGNEQVVAVDTGIAEATVGIEVDSDRFVSVDMSTIGVDAKAETPAVASLAFNVTPKVVVVVSEGSGFATTNDIPNSKITKPIKFRLPLTDNFAMSAKVRHESEDPNYPSEEFVSPVLGVAGSRYVEITTMHFSTFVLSPYNAVVTESDETLGIVKVAKSGKTASGEIVAGVPFGKFDVETGAAVAMTVDQLLVAGFGEEDKIYAYNPAKPSGDEYDMWSWEDGEWIEVLGRVPPPPADSAALASGKAFWFKDVSGSTTPLTLAGLYQESVSTAVDVGQKSLLVNPYPVAIIAAEKLAAGACTGDQFCLVGGDVRYEFRDGAWGTVVKGDVVKTLPGGIKIYGPDKFSPIANIEIPAGKAFWYISTGATAPMVAW